MDYMFMVFFCIIFAIIIVSIIKSMANNNLPRVTVRVTCIGKRKSHSNKTTHYYLKFKFPSTDEYEFSVSYSAYRNINVGDSDDLEFRGSKFISFGSNQTVNSDDFAISNDEFEDYSLDHDHSNDSLKDEVKSEKERIDEAFEKLKSSSTSDQFDDYFDGSRY